LENRSVPFFPRFFRETELRAKLKAAGGQRNPEKQLWYVRYGKISGTTLEKHIHIDESG